MGNFEEPDIQKDPVGKDLTPEEEEALNARLNAALDAGKVAHDQQLQEAQQRAGADHVANIDFPPRFGETVDRAMGRLVSAAKRNEGTTVAIWDGVAIVADKSSTVEGLVDAFKKRENQSEVVREGR